MKLRETKEQYMNDQVGFELALHRVQNKARQEGKTYTFRQMLDMAHQELAEEYDRNVALAATLPDED